MNCEKVKKIKDLFDIAIWFVVIIGVIGGICSGVALKGPTKEAMDAARNLILDPGNVRLSIAAAETAWTTTGTVAMIAVWACSAIISLFLYIKKCQFEIQVAIVNSLNNIERQIEPETHDEVTQEAEVVAE